MKKLVSAFAVCLLAGMVSAQVESQNVVGYNTITLQSEYTLIAVNFDLVGGGNMTINEAFPYQAGSMKAGGLSDSDQIQIRTPGTGAYSTYRLRATSVPANSWCATGTTPSTAPLAAGTPAWYLSRLGPNASTNPLPITVAGQVANDATRSMTIKNGYNLFANPYPYDVELNGAAGIGFQTGMTPGGLSDSDQIQVRSPSTGAYSTYRLRATSVPANSWCATGTTPTTATLLTGSSAWYLARGASDFQLAIQKPAGM